MKGELNMKIRAEWTTNKYRELVMEFDCTDKETDIIKIEYNEISNQLADLLRIGEIKHFLVSIER